jgi:hypothetical protein
MIGRALGIGVRVAGRIAGQQMIPRASPAASPPSSGAPAASFSAAEGRSSTQIAQSRSAGQSGVRFATQAGGVRRGIAGFLQPFRRVGGIVWLEVTGFFFLLFAALFVFRLWQNWATLARQPLERNIVIGVVALFVYLGVTAFWRAHRRSQRG